MNTAAAVDEKLIHCCQLPRLCGTLLAREAAPNWVGGPLTTSCRQRAGQVAATLPGVG